MPKKTWQVNIDGVPHNIEYQYGGLASKRTVLVDGAPVVQAGGKIFESGSDFPFLVGNHWCGVHVRPGFFRNNIDLSLDGNSTNTGRPVSLLQPIPGWAWVFAVACGAIPVVSLGGAIPMVLGVGGAFGCVAVARDPGRPESERLGICVAITAAAWVAWALLIFVVVNAR